MNDVQSGNSITLSDGRLWVEILTPWSLQYRRTRFNRSAFISRVRYDGRTYSRAELDQPTQKSTNGMGLCCEYKCNFIERDARFGETWLKPGVGILHKATSPWTILDEQLLPGLPTTLLAGSNSAVFTCKSPEVNGYAYVEKRVVTLHGREIHLSVELMNAGGKALDLHEYCHNFVTPGATQIDARCRLWLPNILSLESSLPKDDSFVGGKEDVRWLGLHDIPYFVGDLKPGKGSFHWMLEDTSTKWSISGRTSFQPEKVNLWCTTYCVCPEVYHHIVLPAGQWAAWERTWVLT